MTICPDCGFNNIDGVDTCEECQQSLGSLSKRQPTSDVERRVIHDRVRQLDLRQPPLVSPDTPVGDVLGRLLSDRCGCAVIVENGAVAGIFTDHDALDRLNTDAADLWEHPVSQFMTSPVETLDPGDRAAFALHKMDLGGYRHIPIVSEGQVTGILSVRDLLNYITAAL